MVVHSSYMNPWMCLFVGNTFLCIGQSVGDSQRYPVVSNMGEIGMVGMILVLIDEVNKDVKAANEFSDFLGMIGDEENNYISTQESEKIKDQEAAYDHVNGNEKNEDDEKKMEKEDGVELQPFRTDDISVRT